MRYDVMFVGGSFPMPMGGGSVNYVYRLLSEFKEVSLVVYTSSYGKKANEIFDKNFGHKVIRSRFCRHVLGVYHSVFFVNVAYSLISLFQIVYYILKYKPRLVYYTEIDLKVYSFIIARIFRRYKVGLFTYSEEIQQVKDRFGYRSLLYKVLRNVDVVITVCDYTHNMLNDIFNVDNKIYKIVPSVLQSNNGDRTIKSSDGPVIFLTVARLLERKGHNDVIDALCRIYEEYPVFKYIIIGEGEYEETIRHHIKDKHAESFVEMKGKVTDDELIEAYNMADIFVMHHKLLKNGDTEGCPTVFLEASSHRLPVVGGEAGGVSDAIIDGKTGFVCHINTDELYEKLLMLLKDKELRKEMGENGYVYSKQFTISNQSKKFLKITKDFLS